MKQMARVFRLPLMAMAAMLFLMVLVMGGRNATAGEECKVLLQNRCASCHFVKHICPGIEKDSGSIYWKWVMYTMVKEGALLTDQEQSVLVDCLSSRDAQARSFCPDKKE